MSQTGYLRRVKEFRDRRNHLLPTSLSVRDYCLRWTAAFYSFTPEDERLRRYALDHTFTLFNEQMHIESLEQMIVADDTQWRKCSIIELSRISGVDSLTIQKNWGKYFQDAPQKLYNLTVFADAFNRVSIYLPGVKQDIREVMTPR